MAEQAEKGVGTALAEPEAKKEPARKVKQKSATRPQKLPPYNVVLLNDDDHTYQYVIEMLRSLFGYDETKGYKLAKEVDQTGRVIVLTTTKEHAELKRDQIHAFGRDTRISACQGSMSADIEPVAE